MRAKYEQLIALVKQYGTLGSVMQTLYWDQVVMMPDGQLPLRSAQIGTLAAVYHTLSTDPRVGELLAAIDRRQLSDLERANVREIERDYLDSIRVPTRLIEEQAELTSQAEPVWERAKETNDFALFCPYLERLVELSRAIALAVKPDKDPYDTMFENNEPGIPTETFSGYMKDIAATAVPLIAEIAKRPVPDTSLLEARIPEQVQMPFLRRLASALGYDFNRGRLDKSVHPFTADGGRITTRFSEGWLDSITSVTHEYGHALYEMNLPFEHFGTPLGYPRSLGVHESQSRIWENHVGRSLEFWRGHFGKVKAAYAPLFDDITADEFYRLINVVRPSLIRTTADELTYPMHVAVRLEVERPLIGGTLKAADVPGAWRECMHKYLGITPPSDTLGCLQDGHWSGGSFAYFGAYSIGSMLAAQLWKSAAADMPALSSDMETGRFEALASWLRERIHIHGRRYPTPELIERATGEPPGAKAYTEYLERKFSALYGL